MEWYLSTKVTVFNTNDYECATHLSALFAVWACTRHVLLQIAAAPCAPTISKKMPAMLYNTLVYNGTYSWCRLVVEKLPAKQQKIICRNTLPGIYISRLIKLRKTFICPVQSGRLQCRSINRNLWPKVRQKRQQPKLQKFFIIHKSNVVMWNNFTNGNCNIAKTYLEKFKRCAAVQK